MSEANAFFEEQGEPKRGKKYARMARALMHELEAEQLALRLSKLKYTLPEMQPGDVVKATYYESLTTRQENQFQGAWW